MGIIAHISDVFKVDGGDSVATSSLYHAASQDPFLGVRMELQDLVIEVIVIVYAYATWIFRSHYSNISNYNFTCEVESVGHGGHPHTIHGPGQEASQAPGAGLRDQQLRGVQWCPESITIASASSDQQNLS